MNSDLRKKMKSLCRACLTVTNNVKHLESPFVEPPATIKEILEQIVIDEDHLPSHLCQMCLSFLKLSYDFQNQFRKSQTTLHNSTGFNALVDKETLHSEPANAPIVNQPTSVPTVELIYGENTFNLDEVMIVEDESEGKPPTFNGFLRNLGTEITAQFGKDDNFKERIAKEVEESVVIIEHVNNSGNMPVAIPEDEVLISYEVNDVIERPAFLKICEFCGYQCRSRSAVYRHQQRHKINRRRYQCHQCPKIYNTLSGFKFHMDKHRNSKDFLCSTCGKRFNHAISLKYHMKLHTDEKPYVCNYCGLQYRMANTLKRHLSTHTKEKPYKCSFCPKHFASQSETKCHEKVHTGEKPYHCQFCGKDYIKSSNLLYHQLSHPGPMPCYLCPRTFLDKKFLKLHLKRSHYNKL